MEILQQSGLLDGVHTVVYVGGSLGHAIAEVVASNPHIQGINFDLPHVVAAAPAIHGVKHVGGSFFDSVPSRDALFLKFIIHNYAEVIQILKSCFKALPAKNGKLILAKFVYDKDKKSAKARFLEYMDVLMVAVFKGARERSNEQYQMLLQL
ncbi:unnamed protein product [Calypogeia fissa]